MKKVFVTVALMVGILAGPLFNKVAMADTERSTVITPFNQNTEVTVNKDNNTDKSVYKVTSEDVDLLAHMVYGEARGESMKGKVAIAAVILNRTRDARFPADIKDVLFEKDAFTAVRDGQFYLNPDKTAYEAVYQALKGEDPTEGAVYYWNPRTATSPWVWSRTIITQIGQHLFAK